MAGLSAKRDRLRRTQSTGHVMLALIRPEITIGITNSEEGRPGSSILGRHRSTFLRG